MDLLSAGLANCHLLPHHESLGDVYDDVNDDVDDDVDGDVDGDVNDDYSKMMPRVYQRTAVCC